MNAQRTDKKDKVWLPTDFFPEESQQTKPRSARRIAFEFDTAARILSRQRGRR